MLRRSMLALALLFAVGTASGMTPDGISKQQRASMVLTGQITVGADGKVQHYSVDQAEQVPASVRQLVANTVASWHFQPVLVAGRPAPSHAMMSLEVVATPSSDQNMTMQVRRTSFYQEKPIALESEAAAINRVNYPLDALDNGVNALVLVMLELDPQGSVKHADSMQVDVTGYALPVEMARWRREFGEATVDAIKTETFPVPSECRSATASPCYVVAPVEYHIRSSGDLLADDHYDRYGSWKIYTPGPMKLPSWYSPKPGETIPAVTAEQSLASFKQALTLLNPAS